MCPTLGWTAWIMHLCCLFAASIHRMHGLVVILPALPIYADMVATQGAIGCSLSGMIRHATHLPDGLHDAIMQPVW